MKISYNEFDDIKRKFQLVDGVYSIEKNRNEKWIWTSTEFGGVVCNVESITFSFISEIDNILYHNDNELEVKSGCLNVVKIKTEGESEFNIKLENSYTANGDSRDLGVKIVSILVNNNIIF